MQTHSLIDVSEKRTPGGLRSRLDWRGVVLVLVLVTGGIVMACVPRFAQPMTFHDFADKRGWLGVPNFMDVVSNVPFAIVSLWGVLALWRRVKFERGAGLMAQQIGRVDVVMLMSFFVGVGVTSVGSAYYHWEPTNETLVWDRLALLLTFECLLGVLIAERVSKRVAAWLIVPILVAATGSVFYWRESEISGAGDLRWYFFMQGGTLLAVLLLTCLYRARYLPTGLIFAGLGCYALAVVFEQLDKPVWNLWRGVEMEIISGHTIKHLWAAAGAGALAWGIQRPMRH